MSHKVTWTDGTTRDFATDDRSLAVKMAKAYPGLVASIERVVDAEPVTPPPDNRMMDVKAKGTRKRKD